jgi:hypothetical protein
MMAINMPSLEGLDVLSTYIIPMVVLGIFDRLKENVAIFFCIFDIH